MRWGTEQPAAQDRNQKELLTQLHLTLDVNINNANTGPERIARDKNHPFPVAQEEHNTHQNQQQHLRIPLMALQLSGINK